MAGELRLYYGEAELRPLSSTHGEVRKKPELDQAGNPTGMLVPKHHNGVDIYAPAHPFPREVPVVAVCKGEVVFLFDPDSKNDLGNRAWLSPEGLAGVRVIYGHLSRFEGRNRPVKAGEIIGYVGCSGNADHNGACSKAGVHNLTSAHLHLSWFVGNSDKEPLELLGWKLRFGDDLAPKPLPKWEDDKLLSVPVPPDLLHELRTGRLAADKRKPVAVMGKDSGKARILSLPVAEGTALAPTLRCYAQADARWSDGAPGPVTLAEREKGRKAAKDAVGDIESFGKRLGDIVSALKAKAEELAAVTAGNEGSSAPIVWGTHVLLAKAMFLGVEAIWLAAGGTAVKSVGKNRVAGQDSAVPDGAVGVNGRSYVHSFDQGLAALHQSVLVPAQIGAGPPEPFSKWTIMAGFGPGSGRHAVFDAGMGTGLTGDLLSAFKAVVKLVVCQQKLAHFAVTRSPSAAAPLLAGHLTNDGAGGAGYIGRIADLQAAVVSAWGALEKLTGDPLDAWLAALAHRGHAALRVAEKMLAKESKLLCAPNGFFVFDLAPPRKPGRTGE